MFVARFLQLLHDTQFSTVMRNSLWAQPIVETTRVLTLTLFPGFAAVVSFALWAAVGLGGRAIGYVT